MAARFVSDFAYSTQVVAKVYPRCSQGVPKFKRLSLPWEDTDYCLNRVWVERRKKLILFTWTPELTRFKFWVNSRFFMDLLKRHNVKNLRFIHEIDTHSVCFVPLIIQINCCKTNENMHTWLHKLLVTNLFPMNYNDVSIHKAYIKHTLNLHSFDKTSICTSFL